jgi:chemotaxis protein methyltransferase CheR
VYDLQDTGEQNNMGKHAGQAGHVTRHAPPNSVPAAVSRKHTRTLHPAHEQTLEDIEIALLLEGVYRHYGFDFREYSPGSVRRRVALSMAREGVSTISAFQALVLHNPGAMERLLLALSINVTAMFRDPPFYLAFRQKVVPLMRTYPFIRIWNAGCSTGQEAYSIAILMREEGLYERCRIYATDMNKTVLDQAESGIFPLASMQEYTTNYLQSGGTGVFSDLYTAGYDSAIFDSSLKKNIVFAQHNLVTDGAFNEFNVILCRNVMIYFNRSLQDRVHGLMYDSLAPFGVLGLGSKETIRFTSHQGCYKELDAANRLYRKVK